MKLKHLVVVLIFLILLLSFAGAIHAQEVNATAGLGGQDEYKPYDPEEFQESEQDQEKVKKIIAKGIAIHLPEFSANDLSIEEALKLLSDESREFDPEKVGIKIVYKSDSNFASKEVNLGKRYPITLNVRNVSFGNVICLLMQLSRGKYKVRADAVYVCPDGQVWDPLIARTFIVPPGFIKGDVPMGSNNDEVKRELMDYGVNFSNGATAIFQPDSRKLMVKNNRDELEQIYTEIQLFQKNPKFMVPPQNDWCGTLNP